MVKSSDKRFGTVAIALHWTLAVLILVLLGSGFRSGFSADASTKAAVLRVHIPVALAVLVLTPGRVIWWWRFDKKPAPLAVSPAWQDPVARGTHLTLYLLVFAMLGGGIALSILSGAPDAVFGAAPLRDFEQFAPRTLQGIGALLLAGLVALHGAAGLHHHFVRRDATLRRMWFGRGA